MAEVERCGGVRVAGEERDAEVAARHGSGVFRLGEWRAEGDEGLGETRNGSQVWKRNGLQCWLIVGRRIWAGP